MIAFKLFMKWKFIAYLLWPLGKSVKINKCRVGCANKDLWVLCAPIFIIVVYCKTATSYFFGGKE